MLSRHGEAWALESRQEGETHRIELNGMLDYAGPGCSVRLDPETFAVEQSQPTQQHGDLSLRHCAEMYVLLRGLQSSPAFLRCSAGSPSNGRIAHPGYEE